MGFTLSPSTGPFVNRFAEPEDPGGNAGPQGRHRTHVDHAGVHRPRLADASTRTIARPFRRSLTSAARSWVGPPGSRKAVSGSSAARWLHRDPPDRGADGAGAPTALCASVRLMKRVPCGPAAFDGPLESRRRPRAVALDPTVSKRCPMRSSEVRKRWAAKEAAVSAWLSIGNGYSGLSAARGARERGSKRRLLFKAHRLRTSPGIDRGRATVRRRDRASHSIRRRCRG